MPHAEEFSGRSVADLVRQIDENSRVLTSMVQERHAAAAERPTFRSVAEFMLHQYGSLLGQSVPTSAVRIGTKVGETGVYVEGVPSSINWRQFVLRPYSGKVLVLGDEARDEHYLFVGESKERYLDSLPLRIIGSVDGPWIDSELAIPFDEMYTHMRIELPAAALNEYQEYRRLLSGGQKTA